MQHITPCRSGINYFSWNCPNTCPNRPVLERSRGGSCWQQKNSRSAKQTVNLSSPREKASTTKQTQAKGSGTPAVGTKKHGRNLEEPDTQSSVAAAAPPTSEAADTEAPAAKQRRTETTDEVALLSTTKGTDKPLSATATKTMGNGTIVLSYEGINDDFLAFFAEKKAGATGFVFAGGNFFR